jgi:hypothetical protein
MTLGFRAKIASAVVATFGSDEKVALFTSSRLVVASVKGAFGFDCFDFVYGVEVRYEA